MSLATANHETTVHQVSAPAKGRLVHGGSGFIITWKLCLQYGRAAFLGELFTSTGEHTGCVESGRTLDEMVKRLEGHIW
jgi:hypothetical protein